MSSSSPNDYIYGPQDERAGEKLIGNGSSLFTPDYYTQVEITVNGRKVIEERWSDGSRIRIDEYGNRHKMPR